MRRRRRRLREILALPQSDAETRLADRHIKQACEEIQATWSAREKYLRRGGHVDATLVCVGTEAFEPVDVAVVRVADAAAALRADE
jgi:hypothetical protein